MRLSLLTLFGVLATITLLALSGLAVALDRLLTAEADTSANTAVRGALRFLGEVVMGPFDEAVPLTRRNALDTVERRDRCDDGRWRGESMRELQLRYLSTAAGAQAPLYMLYQAFAVTSQAWSLCGCYAPQSSGTGAHCFFYRNATYGVLPSTFPNVSSEVVDAFPGWDFTMLSVVKQARVLTVADRNGTWTAPAMHYDMLRRAATPLLTFVVPVFYGADGRSVVAEAIDVHLESMHTWIRNVTLPDTHVVVVHPARNYVLTTTFPDLAPLQRTTTTSASFWPIAGTGHAEADAAMRHAVSEAGGDLAAFRGVAIGSSGDSIIGVAEVPRDTLRLAVITATPRSAFYGMLSKARIATLTTGVGAAALCMAVAALLSFTLHRSVSRLQDAMALAARLQCDPDEFRAQGFSVVADVAELQEAFAAMNEQLHAAGAFVPQAVRAAWAREGTVRLSSFSAASSSTDTAPHVATPATTTTDDKAQASAVSLTEPHLTGVGPALPESSTDVAQCQGEAQGETTVGEAGPSRGLPPVAPRRHKTRVSVLTVNLVGFAKALEGIDFAAVQRGTAALTDVVVKAATQRGGVLDSFQGDRYVVTFNAATPATSHSRAAAFCALAIAAAARRGVAGFLLPVSAGVATGMATVGHIGCSAARRFGIIGPVVGQSHVLERLCRHYGAKCVIPHSAFDDVRAHTRVIAIDAVRLPGAARATLVGAVSEAPYDSFDPAVTVSVSNLLHGIHSALPSTSALHAAPRGPEHQRQLMAAPPPFSDSAAFGAPPMSAPGTPALSRDGSVAQLPVGGDDPTALERCFTAALAGDAPAAATALGAIPGGAMALERHALRRERVRAGPQLGLSPSASGMVGVVAVAIQNAAQLVTAALEGQDVAVGGRELGAFYAAAYPPRSLRPVTADNRER